MAIGSAEVLTTTRGGCWPLSPKWTYLFHRDGIASFAEMPAEVAGRDVLNVTRLLRDDVYVRVLLCLGVCTIEVYSHSEAVGLTALLE